jgi:hypothetical protein
MVDPSLELLDSLDDVLRFFCPSSKSRNQRPRMRTPKTEVKGKTMKWLNSEFTERMKSQFSGRKDEI